MNKTEYLSELKKRLERFGNELQQEIFDDYVQHFAEGEAAGKSDEEIIEELGKIEDMIQELGEAEEGAQAAACKESTAAEASAVISGGGLQGGCPGEGESEFSRWEEPVGKSFSSLELKTGSADIALEKSEDEWIHVEFRRENGEPFGENIELYQYGEGDTFFAGIRERQTQERKYKFYNRIVTVGNRITSGSAMTLAVKVPQGMKRLKFESKSGDVRGREISPEKLEGSTASGDLRLELCSSAEMKIVTASGDICLNSCDGTNLSNIVTASGDVTLNKSACGTQQVNCASGDVTVNDSSFGQLRMSVASGDIRVKGSACGELQAKAASGDVSCVASGLGEVKIMTSSGDIELNVEADSYELGASSGDICVKAGKPAKRVKAHNCGGDISLDLQGTDDATVELRSRGEISLCHGREKFDVVGRGSLVFGDGSCEIKAESAGGDINVRL